MRDASMLVRLAVFIAAFLPFPSGSFAQEPAQRSATVSVTTLRLRDNATIRAMTLGGVSVEGRLVTTDDSTLTLTAGTTQSRLRLAELDTVWVQRRSAGRGALWGGIASTLLISMAACQGGCSESGVLFPGLLITPLPGLLIGSFVGAHVKRWERRYPLSH